MVRVDTRKMIARRISPRLPTDRLSAAPSGGREWRRGTGGSNPARGPTCRRSRLLAGLALGLCLCLGLGTTARAAQTEIGFLGERVKIHFHPPLRTGPQDPHPLKVEIPRLNLVILLLENYLGYLTKLGKLPESMGLTIHYYPDGSDEFVPGSNRIMITELGWNHLLEQVNGHLKKAAEGTKKYLIDNAGSLVQIRDQLERITDTFEQRSGFTNLSDSLVALSPESDFALLGTDAAIVSRPTETHNQLAIVRAAGSGSLLLPSGRGDYSQFRLSADRTCLAFTEGSEAKLLNLETKEVTPLFPPTTRILLDWAWSPTGRVLAGIALDRSTSAREIFLYDAAAKEQLTFFQGQADFSGDYQFAYPYWAPNGQRLLFTTGNQISLLDLSTRRLHANIVSTARSVSEIVWSSDSQSFAYVEVEGKTRDKNEFNDRDLRGWTLRRCYVTPTGQAIEDPAQTHTSRSTLKLVGFWTLDRVLFLEGHLVSPRLQECVQNLSGQMAARLTPTPGLKQGGSGPAARTAATTGFVDLPLKYCWVIKNLDGRFQNVYDTGYGHRNHLFVEEQVTTWFLGLRLPEGIPARQETYNLLPSPYPYQERNVTICQDLPPDQVKGLTDMVKGYNLRRFEISESLDRIFFLSNTRGMSTLWSGEISGLAKVEVPSGSDDEREAGSSGEGEGEGSGGLPDTLPGEALPFGGGGALPGDALPLPPL
ncbi:MAG: hypothetical protein GX442_13235, partial [Candidatus Riflebacteria bacterium]|nr:hypothetical protein [Candidatus Riflebacteria bacterium]